MRMIELLDRDSGKFFKAGALALLTLLPFFLTIGFVLAIGAPGLLLGCIPTGMLAATGVAGAADTVMRSLRDEVGWWFWDSYKRAWNRNVRSVLIPGAIFGLVIGVNIYLLYYISAMEDPTREFWMLFVGLLVLTAITEYYLPMLVCMELSAGALLRNCFVLFFSHPIKSLLASLCSRERDAYYSMVHFSAMASMNLLKMHLYAGKNHHYAHQGKVIANRYAQLTEECIQRDLELAEEFAAFQDGKWAGMELAPHIGFTKWNEDDCRYPVVSRVTPVRKPSMIVSRSDEEATYTKNYGSPMVINVEDFLDPGCCQVKLEAATGGMPIRIHLEGELPGWLRVTPKEAEVTEQADILLSCIPEKLPQKLEQCTFQLTDGDTVVAVTVSGRAWALQGLPEKTFVPRNGVISILAEHYFEKKDVSGGAFQKISDYGKYGSGMKVFPTTAVFGPEEEKPALRYRFQMEHPGDYKVEFLTAPNNPVEMGSSVNLLVQCRGEKRMVELLPPDFQAGENSDPRWCRGVLDHIHTASAEFHFEKGIQELTVSALEPGVVLEKLLIYPVNRPPKRSYLGPEESWYRK